MSPRLSRVCSIIDCNRCHHAQGYCRRHYGQYVTKARRSAKWPSQTPQNGTLTVTRGEA